MGSRCSRPKVLSSRHFRSVEAWLPWVRASVLSNVIVQHVHRRGKPTVPYITQSKGKSKGIIENFNCSNSSVLQYLDIWGVKFYIDIASPAPLRGAETSTPDLHYRFVSAGFIFAIQQKSITGPMCRFKLSVEAVRMIVLFPFSCIFILKSTILSIINGAKPHTGEALVCNE